MNPTVPPSAFPDGAARNLSGVEARKDPVPVFVPPGTKVSRADTVEAVLRALQNGPDEGVVVLDAKALREASKAFLRLNRVENRGASDEIVPLFTPEHLNVLFGDLSRAQQTFLLLLLRNPGAFVSREELLRAIRGGDGREAYTTHSLNQHAFLLRKKLGAAGRCIETLRGTGFRWNRSKEPKALSARFLKVAGLAMLSLLVVVAGVFRFAVRDPGRDGGPSVSAAPFLSMQATPSVSFGEPSASAGHAAGHSPWRAVDGSEGTWFESAGPARTGDSLSFRLDSPPDPARGRRVEILFGRPGGPPFAPPCRVEWTSAASAGASAAWLPLGDIAPATGRFSADLPTSVSAVRVIVTADSSLPLAVREARIIAPEAE